MTVLPSGSASTAFERRLVIAPMLSGMNAKPPAAAFSGAAGGGPARDWQWRAASIRRILDAIGPRCSPSGRYELGYTLNLSPLGFYRKSGDGWSLNRDEIAASIGIVGEIDRPVVVYLSANHFADTAQTLSKELAADPRNLMWNRRGPLPPDDFFGIPVYAWTLADDEAPINVMRRTAFSAILDEIGKLEPTARGRIVGVSVLGEVHHFCPDFTKGMVIGADYDPTDYSPAAIAQFRRWLRGRFDDVAQLNAAAGTDFTSLDEAHPPSKDAKSDANAKLFEHIDRYATGILPIQGWLWTRDAGSAKVAIYVDGVRCATVAAEFNRTDVTEKRPDVGTPNVGWRYDFDYTALNPGRHTIDVLIVRPGRRPMRLARRTISVLTATSRPAPLTFPSWPVRAAALDSSIVGCLDGPAEGLRLLHNPYARIWLDFRNDQVRQYIDGFADLVAGSGIPHDLIFSHQITPQLVSGWDADLLAVGGSMRASSHYYPGATLYGGSSFGKAFFDLKHRFGWKTYSVPEMHPLVAMTETDLKAMLEAHRRQGARFVSPYFISLFPWDDAKPRTGLDRLEISPGNPAYGSDAFYTTLAALMNEA